MKPTNIKAPSVAQCIKDIQYYVEHDSDNKEHILSTIKTLEESIRREKSTKDNYTKQDILNIIYEYDIQLKLDTFAYTKSCSFTVKEWWNKKFGN